MVLTEQRILVLVEAIRAYEVCVLGCSVDRSHNLDSSQIDKLITISCTVLEFPFLLTLGFPKVSHRTLQCIPFH